MTVADAEFLQNEILKAALTHAAEPTLKDEFGQRYQVEFELETNGKRAIVLTAWILEHDDIIPRLTTCYIK